MAGTIYHLDLNGTVIFEDSSTNLNFRDYACFVVADKNGLNEESKKLFGADKMKRLEWIKERVHWPEVEMVMNGVIEVGEINFARAFFKWLEKIDFVNSPDKIVFRTFGHDAYRVLNALRLHLGIHGKVVSVNDIPDPETTLPKISAVIDDHTVWKATNEDEKFGKKFWIIPSLNQIFADDNYRHDVDDGRNIISPCQRFLGCWVYTKNLPDNHKIVVADRFEILADEDWFCKNLK